MSSTPRFGLTRQEPHFDPGWHMTEVATVHVTVRVDGRNGDHLHCRYAVVHVIQDCTE